MHRWALALGRTVRELEASTTSEEITEAMAYARLEPFGSLHDEFIGGQLCALTFNLNRGKDVEARGARDFMPALGRALKEEPLQMKDAAAQSDLIAARIFKAPIRKVTPGSRRG